MEDALADLSWYEYPVIVKPTDSAGSKGVTRVDSENALRPALEHAFANSISGKVIVEEFIEKMGCSSDSDSFSLNGKLVFCSFSAQRFDENAAGPYVPAAFSWPSTFGQEYEMKLRAELQRLLTLLGMKTSVYNIETRIGKNGKPYIMEVSPRGGGNRLSEMLRYATGVDLITACTRAAVGDSVENVEQKPYKGHWAEVILHADKEGAFKELSISKEIEQYVFERDLWVKEGDQVEAFNGANNAIGTLVLQFDTSEQLDKTLKSLQELIRVEVE